MTDPLALRAALSALGACLIAWPALVEVRGEDGAAKRVNAWAARVAALRGGA